MNPDDASPSWYNGVGPYSGPSSRARSSAQEPTVDADPPSVPELLSSISDNSPVKDVAVTSDNNAQQPDSNQPVSDSEECDSSCICGAGTLLGVFRGVSGKRQPVTIRTLLNFVSVPNCLFGAVRQSVVHFVLSFFSMAYHVVAR